MSTESSEIQFEPLPMKRKVILGADANQYCVRTASGESREIKADTAYEAFKNSGFKSAIKIERLSNIVRNIIEKSKFTDEQTASGATGKTTTLHERILQLKNPIISADELDELMRSTRKEPEATTQLPVAPEATASLVPAPSASPVQAGTPSAIGMDVHEDGFDEIVPATPSVKPPLTKQQDAKDASNPATQAEGLQPADAPVAPRSELTSEEVDKLLGGKE